MYTYHLPPAARLADRLCTFLELARLRHVAHSGMAPGLELAAGFRGSHVSRHGQSQCYTWHRAPFRPRPPRSGWLVGSADAGQPGGDSCRRSLGSLAFRRELRESGQCRADSWTSNGSRRLARIAATSRMSKGGRGGSSSRLCTYHWEIQASGRVSAPCLRPVQSRSNFVGVGASPSCSPHPSDEWPVQNSIRLGGGYPGFSPLLQHSLPATRFLRIRERKRGLQLRTYAGLSRNINRKSSKSAKSKKVYVCSECGEGYSQWWGKCESCGANGTIKQHFIQTDGGSGGATGGGGAGMRVVDRLNPGTNAGVQGQLTFDSGERDLSGRRMSKGGKGTWVDDMEGGPQRLADIVAGDGRGNWRMELKGDGGKELSRVLGGGIVPGSLILVGGDPGVGKSTLLLQVAGLLAEGGERDGPAPVLYISGEESVDQVRNRAERMGVSAEELYLYSATDMELILEWIHRLAPRAVVVDSIQTVYLEEATGSAGSTSQVRECATALLHAAKRSGIAIFLVGHVTKTGDIAGPRVLEHIVDVVLYMEGEGLESHRLVRGVKNRYGATDEVGVFEMAPEGLVAVSNPSLLFLSERSEAGGHNASVAVVMQGTRPLLLEVQALCSPVAQPPGGRSANGVDGRRMALLLAVLAKRAGLKLYKHDIFVNVVGGLQLKEPGADLAVVMAIASSLLDVPVPADMAFIGEIGLHGELRSVGQLERRLGEAAKLGFKRCIVPARRSISASSGSRGKGKGKGGGQDAGTIMAIPCGSVREALERALGVVIGEEEGKG